MFQAVSRGIPSFGDQAYKAPVANATSAALPANTRTGNTLTASANGALGLVDGVGNTPGDRILVKNEATGANNGIYSLVAIGDGTHPWSMTRSTDTDTAAEAVQGAMTFVLNGTVNKYLTFMATAVWSLNVSNPVFLAVQVKPGEPPNVVSVVPAGTPSLKLHGLTGSGEPTLTSGVDGDTGARLQLGGGTVGLQLGAGAAADVVRLFRSGVNIAQLDDGGGNLAVGLVGKAPVVNIYAANTTWTKPAGLDHVTVECVGGGGQGGGSAATAAGQGSTGGGGGGGGYGRRQYAAATLTGATYTVVVGAGGSTGGAGAAGQAGGNSTFAGTNILTLQGNGGGGGGAPGVSAVSGIFGTGGAGGTGANGDANTNGSDGANGGLATGTPIAAGQGGASALGGGGRGAAGGNNPGVAGSQYGGGGGGATTSAAAGAARAGAVGGAGVVIVTEYYGP